jgi:tetratricopeptide (TPR) repeat protein
MNDTRCRIASLSIWLVVAATAFVGGCGSAPVARQYPATDEQYERLHKAAMLAFEKEKYPQAASLYRQALERAYIRDNLDEIADTQYNLAFCLMRLQSYEQALDLINRSKTGLDRAHRKYPVDLLLLEAAVLHRRGKLDRAWQVTDQILLAATQKSSIIDSKTHYLRGLIAYDRSDPAQLGEEIAALGAPEQPSLRADLKALQGYRFLAQSDWMAAIEVFDQAIVLRRETQDYRGMVKLLAMTGAAFEKAGQPAESALRYFNAGRSAALQGENENAKHWLSRAEQLAVKAGDEQMVQEVRDYLHRLQESQAASGETSGQ